MSGCFLSYKKEQNALEYVRSIGEERFTICNGPKYRALMPRLQAEAKMSPLTLKADIQNQVNPEIQVQTPIFVTQFQGKFFLIRTIVQLTPTNTGNLFVYREFMLRELTAVAYLFLRAQIMEFLKRETQN